MRVKLLNKILIIFIKYRMNSDIYFVLIFIVDNRLILGAHRRIDFGLFCGPNRLLWIDIRKSMYAIDLFHISLIRISHRVSNWNLCSRLSTEGMI